MRKYSRLLIKGIILCFFVIAMLWVGEMPVYSKLTYVGEFLLQDSNIYFKQADEKEVLLKEILGGHRFFDVKEEDVKRQVLLENSQATVIQEKQGQIGDVYTENSVVTMGKNTWKPQKKNNAIVEKLRNTADTNYLWNKFYIIDSTTSVKKEIFNVNKLLNSDMTMKKKKGKYQILIYHTHGATEYFKDSKVGKKEDSVVGIGRELKKELEKKGYCVYHDETLYDSHNGKIDRSLAYNYSLEGVEKILKENKDIEIIIDLHRDAVGKGKHTYTTINGKPTALVMFFNGLSRTKSGDIDYLYNPNLQDNLAFSLQLKCKAMEYYEGFTKPIYLKGYRYNLHLKKKSLLIEWGNENNTVEEAKNAVEPMAFVLDKVLSGKD